MHRIKRGLDVPITGAPAQQVEAAPAVERVAVVASDFVGLKPRMGVDVGDVVKRGQPLFEDRKREGVVHTAPAAGTILAIHRGAKRAFISMVIELSDNEKAGGASDSEFQSFGAFTGDAVAELSGDQVRDLLVESGLWTALRTRPFSRVPNTTDEPKSIFVTAIDTNPNAPEVEAVLAGHEDDFAAGVAALGKLASKVFVCTKAGSSVKAAGAQVEQFEGPHPAGLVGTHIHTLDPASRSHTVWHAGYQDVISIGALFRTGKLTVRRVVALCGPAVKKPRLLETRVGASVDTLVAGELTDGDLRVLSGSVLAGTIASGEQAGYLGRYDNQIAVLVEGRHRDFLGWLTPGMNIWSTMPTFLSGLLPGGKKYDLTTAMNGSHRAMTPIGRYENVMPLDILPTFLLRSLLSGDLERAEQLGALELDEEDLALCSVVCPNKQTYGPELRKVLSTIEAEG
ncbi:MAG: Na(+)-translocating NADH-quinone reductase subunit A [Proteobacteria bacterium]|nr:Na(+)-translocating NADH-quinone reductase subunit A [Pseudomonadota bacterium]MCP4920968.1 Na(+)-translocating NADH-quinone reductase subunit A [Pseudomonadota bacterium]